MIRFLCCVFALSTSLAAPHALAAPTLSLLPDQANHVSLPFEIESGFILLPGAVRGVPGVSQFDTGTPFTLRFDGFDDNRPNLPYVMTRVAGLDIEVMFDTGTAGYLDLTPQGRQTLEAAQAIRTHANGAVSLPGLTLGGQPAPNAATLIQASTRNRLVMGYASLVLYRSIWNYPRGEITLIPLRAQP